MIRILQRTLSYIGPVEILVPIAFAALFSFLYTSMPVLGPTVAVVFLCSYPLYVFGAMTNWVRGTDNVGAQLRLGSSAAGAPGLVLLAIAAGVVFVMRRIEPWPVRDLSIGLALIWLPASMMILALSQSLVEAMNPAAVMRAIAALKLDYVWVWIISVVLLIVAHETGQDSALFLHTASLLIAGTLSGTAIAAAAFERREALKHDVSIAADLASRPRAPKDRTEQEFLRRTQVLEREKGPEAALKWLIAEIDAVYAPDSVHRKAIELAVAVGDTPVVGNRGAALIRRALDQEDSGLALQVAGTCLAAVPDFTLGDMEQDDALIALAQRKDRPDLVLGLCRNFIARFDRYKRSVDHAMTAAELLAHRYGRVNEARAMLQDAIDRGAKDAQLRAVNELMEDLEGV